MKSIAAETTINASAQRVWKILTEFAKYEEWNPFIRKISGRASEGSKIQIHIETPSGTSRRYTPTITKVQEERELRWLGRRFFLNGEHIFTIERIGPKQVSFVQQEIFDGLLVVLFGSAIDKDIATGLAEMNEALKRRAEQNES